MLDYLPPSRGPLFQFPAKKAFLESPDPADLTRSLFYVIWLHRHRDPEAQNVLNYPPPSRGPLFQFPTKKAILESPDQWLSPELYCRSLGHTHKEIWRLKMCSTICPLPGAHCFSCLQVRHFRKAPTGWLSPQLYFRSFGHTHKEIWRLQMCLTTCPLPEALTKTSL